jgi:hypothetical protein
MGLPDPETEAACRARLRDLFEAERYAEFQQQITAAIARIDPDGTPDPGHLAWLLRLGGRACLDHSTFDDLLARARPSCRRSPELRLAWGAAATRARFRQLLAAALPASFELVSIGLHCLPWTLGNRWGFRTAAQFATSLNPFCLAIHKPAGVIAALADDFATYAEAEALRITTTPRGHRIPMRADGTAVWNHNKEAWWFRDGFAPLLDGMRRKAEAFRASARNPGAVFLLGNAGVFDADEDVPFLPALREALAHATGRADSRLILTAQPRGGSDGQRWIGRDTVLLVRPYPARDYAWYDDDTADSAAGLTFERGYATAVLRCLHRWGIASREASAA